MDERESVWLVKLHVEMWKKLIPLRDIMLNAPLLAVLLLSLCG